MELWGPTGGAPIHLREAVGRGGTKKNLERSVREGRGRLPWAGGKPTRGPEMGTQRGRLARPQEEQVDRSGWWQRRKGKQRAGRPGGHRGEKTTASCCSAKGPQALAKGWQEDMREF